MSSSSISGYLTLMLFLLITAYAGTESTLRSFAYLDSTFRFQIIKFKLKWMKWNLEKKLGLPHKNYNET